ncbi:MAG: ATP-binding cassette domain-containing protein, partial [Mobilicoccus sp.]|nr:ATP-binding cassette domain-containing protein [Mobilicoccus sp.]
MIEIQGLTKTFGAQRAVDNLTFTAPSGRVTGFLGPNGAGKSTTLRMICGLATPDAG